MTNWESKLKESDRVLRTLAPKMKALRIELKVLEYIYTFNAKLKFEAERHIVPIKIIPPRSTSNKPEQKAEVLLKRAKALSSEDKGELLKALQGMM